MQDGLYKVAFFLGADSGSGVVTLLDNKITGGDGSFAYKGEVTQAANGIMGSIKIWQHSAGISLLPGINSFLLNVHGTDGGNTVKLTGTTPSAPSYTIHIELTALEPQ